MENALITASNSAGVVSCQSDRRAMMPEEVLKRHLTTSHGLSVDQYSIRWNLSREHPMTAPSYSERRSGLAKELDLGRGRRQSCQKGRQQHPNSFLGDEEDLDRRRQRPSSTSPGPNGTRARHPARALMIFSRVSDRVAVIPAARLRLRCDRCYAIPSCALYTPRKSA